QMSGIWVGGCLSHLGISSVSKFGYQVLTQVPTKTSRYSTTSLPRPKASGASLCLVRVSRPWRLASQDLPVDRCIDVAAGQNDRDPLSGHPGALLHEPGKRGCTRAFRNIVRVLEI